MKKFKICVNIVIGILSVIVLVIIFSTAGYSQPWTNDIKSNTTLHWKYVEENGETSDIKLPCNLEKETNHICTIMAKIPDDYKNGYAILFRSAYQSVEFKILDNENNEQVFYEYDDINRPFGIGNIPQWNLGYLPDGCAGKNLVVTTVSPLKNYSGKLNEIHIEQPDILISSILNRYRPNYIIGMLLFYTGIVIILFYIAFSLTNSKNNKILALGLLTIFTSCWMISESRIIEFMYSNTFFMNIVTFLSLRCLAITLPYYIMQNKIENAKTHNVINTICRVFIYLSFAELFVTFALHYFNIYDFVQTLVGVHIILALELALLIYTCIVGYMSNKKSVIAKNELIGFSFLTVSVAVEMVIFYNRNYNSTGVVSNIGLMICILYISIGIVLEMIDEIKKQELLKSELNDTQNYLKISQIKPHFIYNSLGAIRALIKKSPDLAYDAMGHFARYLRENISTQNTDTLIPFSQELEHIKHYVYIEQLRFGDRVQVEYDTKVVDFMLPPLSIQPIVENAIKHGICNKIMGGTVKVSSYQDAQNYYIVVADDGVGFDVSKLDSSLKKGSIGLVNIKFRLEQIAKAKIYFKSTIGVGTTVTVTLKKDGKTR